MGKHAIIVIKNRRNEYLQKYIESWNSYLFPNCKVNSHLDTDIIRNYILEELNVKKIDVEYVDKRVHTKFSEKDKILKEYVHYFFSVNINENYKIDAPFKWFSMNNLENDKRIMEVNNDIVGFIKELKL